MDGSSSRTLLSVLWLASILVAAGIGYLFGLGGKMPTPAPKAATPQESITAFPTQPIIAAVTTTNAPTPAQAVDLESICEKTGPSQKKDYLKPYTLKEGDTINSIAEKELGAVSRNTEITVLNDNIKQLSVGSILYLPPDFITESSGHIYEISGKLVKKDNSSWQLSYGGGPKGPGILMPGFWFRDIPNVNDFQIGDCVTILFDNEVKVYTVKKS